MVDNFDEVKSQLKELATVINTFKSESVQLRIIEIVLSGANFPAVEKDAEEQLTEKRKPVRRRKRPTKAASNPTETADGNAKTKRRSTGLGAVATLGSVYDAGFFSKSRAIKDILNHCATNLARKIKVNEISGKLGRMVRNGELTRAKNSDGQYEYKNA